LAFILNKEETLKVIFKNMRKEFNENPAWSIYNLSIERYDINTNTFISIITFENRTISQEDLKEFIAGINKALATNSNFHFIPFMEPDFEMTIKKAESDSFQFNINIDLSGWLSDKKHVYGNNFIAFQFKVKKETLINFQNELSEEYQKIF